MKKFTLVLPILVPVLIGLIYIGSKVRVPQDPSGEMKIREFGQLPVMYQGRIKPFDTLARNSLLIISDRQTFTDNSGQKQPAIAWLLDVISLSPEAREHKVFRIENLDVLHSLDLERREGFRYALEEFEHKRSAIREAAERASELKQGQRDAYQNKIGELERQLSLYESIKGAHGLDPEMMQNALSPERFESFVTFFEKVESRGMPMAIPPAKADGQWYSFMGNVLEMMWQMRTGRLRDENRVPNPEATTKFMEMLRAYKADNAKDFNEKLAAYHANIEQSPPKDVVVSKLDFEVFFNHFQPFYVSSVLYVGVFLLSFAGWMMSGMAWSAGTKHVNRAALSLLLVAFCLHTFALWARIHISGRPPVTNLYSSAVFIGWGCVVLGLVLEAVYRIGVGNIVASVAGFATLIIAHFLSGDGDTFEMLQAVLDTQFWLATHVVCITLGYSATYLAGLLGLYYIVSGVYTPGLTRELSRKITRMTYGTICFALFLSFVGTVLGGLWADDSWGRFWGWDPKENGALIIVIWNALILHARWGGMVRDRGVAALSVFGIVVTSWSWFGVNELGAGLHSYGFTEGTVFWISVLGVLFPMHLIMTGLFPWKQWMSQETAAQDEDKSKRSALDRAVDRAVDRAKDQGSVNRPLPLTLIAYLNPLYSYLMGVALMICYSLESVAAAPKMFFVFLALSYIATAVLMYYTSAGLLKRKVSGLVCGNVAAVSYLCNIAFLILQYDVQNWGVLIPAMAYPVGMLIILNLKFASISGQPQAVQMTPA